MADPKLPSNATASMNGIVHQFYIALDKCFSLSQGEKMYVEKYGDVTISGKEQIEVKDYTAPLTDLDHNIWNTLKNWLNEGFKPEEYKDLILLTTQEFGSHTNFSSWNTLNAEGKLHMLSEIKEKHEKRIKPDKSTVNLLAKILDPTIKERLLLVLGKFSITVNAPSVLETYNKLVDSRAQHIIPEHKNTYIDSLMGYIISPDAQDNNGWEITYEKFASKVTELSEQFAIGTILFPIIKVPQFTKDEYTEELFVKKIKDIEYDEVINEAVSNYLRTLRFINDEFKCHNISKEQHEQFVEDVLQTHSSQYRAAKLECTPADDIIRKSKIFYNNMQSKHTRDYYKFNNTPQYFSCGIMHQMANDSSRNLKWNLSDE